MSEPNFHQSQGILYSFRAVIGLSLIAELKLLNQASDGIDDTQDVLLSKFTLLSVELRVAIDGHLNNLLLGNENHLSFASFFRWRTNLQCCCLCILSFLF